MQNRARAEREKRAAEIANALRSKLSPELGEARTSAGETHATTARVPEPEVPGIDYARTLGFFRWYDGLLQAHMAIAGAIAEGNAGAAAATGCEADLDPQLTATLAAAHRILLMHPLAAKSMFCALIAQGRDYARSAEGEALRERLSCSSQVRRAGLLWRSLSQGMFSEEEPGELPETYVDTLFRAIDRPDLVALLSQLASTRGNQP